MAVQHTTYSSMDVLEHFFHDINVAIGQDKPIIAIKLSDDYVNFVVDCYDATNKDDVYSFNLWLHIYKASLSQLKVWAAQNQNHEKYAQVSSLVANDKSNLLAAINGTGNSVSPRFKTDVLKIAAYDLALLTQALDIADKMPLKQNDNAIQEAIKGFKEKAKKAKEAKQEGTERSIVLSQPLIPEKILQEPTVRKNTLFNHGMQAAKKRQQIANLLERQEQGQEGELIVARLQFAATVIASILTLGLVPAGMLAAAAVVNAQEKGSVTWSDTANKFDEFSGYRELQQVEKDYETKSTTKRELRDAFFKSCWQPEPSINTDGQIAASNKHTTG